jgi:hypothetical protein
VAAAAGSDWQPFQNLLFLEKAKKAQKSLTIGLSMRKYNVKTLHVHGRITYN